MRLAHFNALRPSCPVCRRRDGSESTLALGPVAREIDGVILEGVLHCPSPACLHEYPILDGIPCILPEVRAFLAGNLYAIMARDDLSEASESLLGDACGPSSAFDSLRQHLSTYAWDHWADLDPAESKTEPPPGAVLAALDAGLALLGERARGGHPDPPRGDAQGDGPLLDLGCAVGRTSFALAERFPGRLVLGVDANYAMLRLATRALAEGIVRYPRRRVGIVYDRREFEVTLPQRENVDFWAADALALPFPRATFDLITAMNLLDCVPAPRELLSAIAALLRVDGAAVITTPYDWSPGATAPEAWLGGHSQRGPAGGASEPLLRALLTRGAHPQSIDGLAIAGEIADFPWQTRLHDRSTVKYALHIVAARHASADP